MLVEPDIPMMFIFDIVSSIGNQIRNNRYIIWGEITSTFKFRRNHNAKTMISQVIKIIVTLILIVLNRRV